MITLLTEQLGRCGLSDCSNHKSMFHTFRDIFAKHFVDTLSTIIVQTTNFADHKVRTLCFLITLLVVTPNHAQENDASVVIPWIDSSRGRDNRGDLEKIESSLYVGYNPWGTSAPTIHATYDHYQSRVVLQKRNIFATRNDSKITMRKITPKVDGSLKRTKRGAFHLYNMLFCATGCNPLAYKGYGCYCGFLGSGFTIDGIDRCCKMHDWCYAATDCPMFSEYFVPYYWKCYRGNRPICAIEHGDFGGSGSCAQRLCECDRALAECLRRYPCPTTKAVCTSSPWRLVQNLFMLL